MSERRNANGTAEETVPFPSVTWFERLAKCMREARSHHEKLGYVDCVVHFKVTDGGRGGAPWCVQVTFEEFEAIDVQEVSAPEGESPDFLLEASLATWQEMIESIAAGEGRPGLEHTLNRLSHMGTPMRVSSDDPLRRDKYFRYNQSFQTFVNASSSFRTIFPARG